jgi:hypothetical protein
VFPNGNWPKFVYKKETAMDHINVIGLWRQMESGGDWVLLGLYASDDYNEARHKAVMAMTKDVGHWTFPAAWKFTVEELL